MNDVRLHLTKNSIGLTTKVERVDVAKSLVTGESVALKAVHDDWGTVMVFSEVAIDLGGRGSNDVNLDVSAS